MKLGASTLLPAICHACRCLHPRCGADGVHGPWRRTPAASAPGSPARPRSASASAARTVICNDSSSPTTTRAATRSARRSGFTGSSTRSTQCWNPQICIGENPPPPPGNELIFLGRYRLTSWRRRASRATCPTRQDVDLAAVPLRGHRAGQRPEPSPIAGRLLLDHAVEVRPQSDVAELDPGDRVLRPGRHAERWESHRRITPRTLGNHGGQKRYGFSRSRCSAGLVPPSLFTPQVLRRGGRPVGRRSGRRPAANRRACRARGRLARRRAPGHVPDEQEPAGRGPVRGTCSSGLPAFAPS